MAPRVTIFDFEANDFTPEFENYVDDDNDIEGNPNELHELPVSPEFNDQYLNIELMLPHRGEYVRGCVTERARGNDGKKMERANDNPILGLKQYVVKFEDGTKDELAANTISQSMYAQYDPDGNKYLLLDSIVEFYRSTTAICHDDHKLVKNGCTYLRRSTAGWQICFQ